uniref:Uncharacterized protein n=2 Tax=Caenorhabditis japonica TaxID=281687 RepID=A0A8R1IE71_CAEJA
MFPCAAGKNRSLYCTFIDMYTLDYLLVITCEFRPQFPSWILRTKLRQVTRSLPTVDHARFASSMPILRRPCPRLPLRASLWMKILIESVMSSAHLFGGRPRGRADPLGSHSDTIFAHLSYFMRDTCPAHFSFLRKTCFFHVWWVTSGNFRTCC